MARNSARNRIESLLAFAGARIDGNAPSDLQVHDERLYSRIVAHGSLGFGEAYMDGWWDAADLDGFLFRLLACGNRRMSPEIGRSILGRRPYDDAADLDIGRLLDEWQTRVQQANMPG